MSADNMLILLTSPLPEGRKEYRILEVRLSSFNHEAWSKGTLGDELLAEFSLAREVGRFSALEAAMLAMERYLSEQVVEYGASSYEIQFPYPGENEIKEGRRRWEETLPLRRARQVVSELEYRIGNILAHTIPNLEKAIEIYQEQLQNPDMADWHQTIREEDIPEARKEFSRCRAQLAQCRAKLEAARAAQREEHKKEVAQKVYADYKAQPPERIDAAIKGLRDLLDKQIEGEVEGRSLLGTQRRLEALERAKKKMDLEKSQTEKKGS